MLEDKDIEDAIARVVSMTGNNGDSADDLRLTQAALNLAHTLAAIRKIESMLPKK